MLHLVNDTFQHTLQWDEPFTWMGFPITGYTINITNHSNGESTTISMLASSYFNHSIASDEDLCYELEVALSASNRIGSSKPSIKQTGHPMGKTIKINIHCVIILVLNYMQQSKR